MHKEKRLKVTISYEENGNYKTTEIIKKDPAKILDTLPVYANGSDSKILCICPMEETEVDVMDADDIEFPDLDWGRKPAPSESDSSENSADR